MRITGGSDFVLSTLNKCPRKELHSKMFNCRLKAWKTSLNTSVIFFIFALARHDDFLLLLCASVFVGFVLHSPRCVVFFAFL